MKIVAAIIVLLLAALAVAWPRDQFVAANSPADWAPTAVNIARGAYLARAGDCVSCHTARGGIAYAGGRALATPFGTVYGPNLTPDRATGIGTWSADDFWGALHNGRARDGRYLYPAFPYPHFTKTNRADSDALYVYLHSLPATHQPNVAHALAFPFNTQLALAGWRLFFFRPGQYAPTASQSASWNRGAYLVGSLGHCSACHSSRNVFGASAAGLRGGSIPVSQWYAPALSEDLQNVAQLLHTGVAPHTAVSGPMAEVVANSLQYLALDDVNAMESYIQTLPPGVPPATPVAPDDTAMAAGRKLYGTHCADCHGSDGHGAVAAYPALAGRQSINAVRIVLAGGFPPGTAGNPRPYGMPPFAHVLSDEEVAQVVTYVRSSWGNRGGAVTPAEVNQARGGVD